MKKIPILFFFVSLSIYAQTDNRHYINAGVVTMDAKAFVGEIFIVQQFTGKSETNNLKQENEVTEQKINFADSDIILYPNPAEHTLYLESKNEVITKIEIYNNLGNIILSKRFVKGNAIDVQGLSFGTYNIHVFTENNIQPTLLTFIKI